MEDHRETLLDIDPEDGRGRYKRAAATEEASPVAAGGSSVSPAFWVVAGVCLVAFVGAAVACVATGVLSADDGNGNSGFLQVQPPPPVEISQLKREILADLSALAEEQQQGGDKKCKELPVQSTRERVEIAFQRICKDAKYGPKAGHTKVFHLQKFAEVPQSDELEYLTTDEDVPRNRYTFLVQECCNSWEEEARELVDAAGGDQATNSQSGGVSDERWKTVKETLVAQGFPPEDAEALVAKLRNSNSPG
ncbi:unnamed protein product, partial [Amoebophrya sp. A120]|eukprot:GSA120T00021675001.1